MKNETKINTCNNYEQRWDNSITVASYCTCRIRLAYVNGGLWLIFEYRGIALRNASWVSVKKRKKTFIYMHSRTSWYSTHNKPDRHWLIYLPSKATGDGLSLAGLLCLCLTVPVSFAGAPTVAEGTEYPGVEGRMLSSLTGGVYVCVTVIFFCDWLAAVAADTATLAYKQR